MEKIVTSINVAVKYFLFLLLTVLIVAVFAQVIFRFAINQPLAWTEELARYCLVWITFLGAAFAMSQNAHVGLEFFKNLLPNLGQKIITILSAFISILFFLIMLVQGFELMSRSMTQLSPVLQLPMGFVYSILPISAVLLLINVVFVGIKELRGVE